MSEDTRALAGIRVIDLSNFLAGPLVSMYLGDFGAEVVKVEKPETGDELRLWGHEKDGVGLYFKVVNRNKKSVTGDLRTPLGVEIVKRLAAGADVVVENYRPGTLERWGLGYDILSEINPRLVLLRVSGFGQTGPYSARPGFGTLAEAFSGYANITGEREGPPLLPVICPRFGGVGFLESFSSKEDSDAPQIPKRDPSPGRRARPFRHEGRAVGRDLRDE